MTREEAHTLLEVMAINLTGAIANSEDHVTEQTKLMAKQIEAIDMAIEALSAEAVQGEWTYLSGSKGSYMTISCPICGSTFNGVPEWKYHYCPNCGARMTPYKGGDNE